MTKSVIRSKSTPMQDCRRSYSLAEALLEDEHSSAMHPFADVPKAPVDPMYILKKRFEQDISPTKVDLGVGVYRNESGAYHELPVIRKV